jgi:hypothetical protein
LRTTEPGSPRRLLSDDELARFGEQGFLHVDRPIIPAAAVAEVVRLLDALFARADDLPPALVHDLGGGSQPHPGPPSIPEIVNPLHLEPRLRRSRAYAVCRQVSGELLGTVTRAVFDHAIYKPAGNESATEWHQDRAYTTNPRRTVHLWVALQDVPAHGGCMEFLPRSHVAGSLGHHPTYPGGAALRADVVDAQGAVACPLPAGGLTVHTPDTLHFTGPNRTDVLRRAWVVHFEADGRSPLARRLSESALGDWRRGRLQREVGRRE